MEPSINVFDKEIKSERLNLRKIKLSDLNDIFEYSSNPLITKHLFWNAHSTIEQSLNFINNTLDEYKNSNSRYTWGITLKETDKLIGVVSIFFISFVSKRVELSYILNPNYQGKGYMKEALKSLVNFIFDELHFNRIQARCTEENEASLKVMKSLNMNYEGKLLDYWYLKDKFYDVLIYAIINKNKKDE